MNARLTEKDLQELEARYRATDVPACRVCGAPLVCVASGGGSPTRYACSTQESVKRPVDWEHYERSRWEDRHQGGDSRVMDLVASYRRLAADLAEAITVLAALPSRPKIKPADPRAPARAPKATHKSVAMSLLPERTECVRQLNAGNWAWCVLLPSGQCIGKDASPQIAWRQARAWAEQHRREKAP
ncbi:hypothetical protein [Variovorax gossypii]